VKEPGGRDVSPILRRMLSRRGGPDPDHPPRRRAAVYSLRASLMGDLLRVKLTFLSGVTYCCFEPGCHLPLYSGKRWVALRRRLSLRREAAVARLRLHLTGVVQRGARSFDWTRPDHRFRLWYGFREERAGWKYRTRCTEGGSGQGADSPRTSRARIPGRGPGHRRPDAR
jgi:hypothetical protein